MTPPDDPYSPHKGHSYQSHSAPYPERDQEPSYDDFARDARDFHGAAPSHNQDYRPPPREFEWKQEDRGRYHFARDQEEFEPSQSGERDFPEREHWNNYDTSVHFDENTTGDEGSDRTIGRYGPGSHHKEGSKFGEGVASRFSSTDYRHGGRPPAPPGAEVAPPPVEPRPQTRPPAFAAGAVDEEDEESETLAQNKGDECKKDWPSGRPDPDNRPEDVGRDQWHAGHCDSAGRPDRNEWLAGRPDDVGCPGPRDFRPPFWEGGDAHYYGDRSGCHGDGSDRHGFGPQERDSGYRDWRDAHVAPRDKPYLLGKYCEGICIH